MVFIVSAINDFQVKMVNFVSSIYLACDLSSSFVLVTGLINVYTRGFIFLSCSNFIDKKFTIFYLKTIYSRATITNIVI